MSELGRSISNNAAPLQLPMPFPDELLYSVIARSAYRNAHWSPKGLMEAAFGDPTVLASPDLPGRLDLLCRPTARFGAAWSLTPREIALQYTLVGYYTHYLGETERDRMVALMAGKSAHLHLRLGICAGVVKMPKVFRLCPVCTDLDLRKMGETYWRRSHQLPGVLVCPLHAVPLWQTQIPLRPLGRREHIYARRQFLESGCFPLEGCAFKLEELLELAGAASRLLDAAVSNGGPLHDYREALRSRGLHGVSGVDRVWRALLSVYGLDVMRLLTRGGEETQPPAWLWEMFRRPRRPLHPLKHLLVERLLREHAPQVIEARPDSGKTWGIYRATALRDQAQRLVQSGLTVNAVAQQLGLDWKTVYRLLQPLPVETSPVATEVIQADRGAWLAISARLPEAGRTQWRRQNPALYARMYRRDREWLMANGDRLKISPAKSRVDWRQRDAVLAKSIQAQAHAVTRQEPMHRVSASYVLGTLGARTVVSRYAQRLPLTQAALLGNCEVVEDFQVRRLVVRGGVEGLRFQPVWRLMRTAGLNPDRFSDKGAGIVERARRLVEVRRSHGADLDE